VAAAAIAVGVMAGLAGCGEQEERSLCAVYGSYRADIDALSGIDPSVATTEEVSAALDAAIGSVRQLSEVADARYVQHITDLEAALLDVQRVVDSQDVGEDPSTWMPLVEDSLEDATSAAARVSEAIDPSCEPGS
jgi:hypothetical protein